MNTSKNSILLRIISVTKTYNDGHIIISALKGVNLDIYKGEILSLLGVNGAGKTTLSSIIASLHPATNGEVLNEHGTSIYKDVVQYRKTIGFCPQKPNIDLTISIEQNLYFAGLYFGMNKAAIAERTSYLLNRFELTKYRNSKASILSGGYKQRLLLARTIMHRPSLVILDEPTVGLDPHVRREIWDIIKDLKKDGITVILTTHYLDEAEKLSDRVCILDKGIIQVIDTPENLKQQKGKGNLEDIFVALIEESKQEQAASQEGV